MAIYVNQTQIRTEKRAAGNGRTPRGKRGCCRRTRGVAAVEFAIVLPLILTLTFAAVDFGRVMHAYLVVSNAARCGAEYGSMHGFTAYSQASWQTQVLAAAATEMQNLPGYSAANSQTTCTTTTDSDGLFQVTVTASYPFTTVVSWPGVPAAVQLSHQVVMRQIR
jgi:Flp pilus assembly protein TadG